MKSSFKQFHPYYNFSEVANIHNQVNVQIKSSFFGEVDVFDYW